MPSEFQLENDPLKRSWNAYNATRPLDNQQDAIKAALIQSGVPEAEIEFFQRAGGKLTLPQPKPVEYVSPLDLELKRLEKEDKLRRIREAREPKEKFFTDPNTQKRYRSVETSPGVEEQFPVLSPSGHQLYEPKPDFWSGKVTDAPQQEPESDIQEPEPRQPTVINMPIGDEFSNETMPVEMPPSQEPTKRPGVVENAPPGSTWKQGIGVYGEPVGWKVTPPKETKRPMPKKFTLGSGETIMAIPIVDPETGEMTLEQVETTVKTPEGQEKVADFTKPKGKKISTSYGSVTTDPDGNEVVTASAASKNMASWYNSQMKALEKETAAMEKDKDRGIDIENPDKWAARQKAFDRKSEQVQKAIMDFKVKLRKQPGGETILLQLFPDAEPSEAPPTFEAAQPSEETVMVRSPNGKLKRIPKGQLEKAVQSGGTLVQ